MKYVIALIAIVAAVVWLVGRGLDREPPPADAPNVLRTPLTAEMKTLLREVRVAQEAASLANGRYLSLSELRGRYFNSPVRPVFQLSIDDVTATGYRAEVIHGKTGVRCWSVVGPGRAGAPTCK